MAENKALLKIRGHGGTLKPGILSTPGYKELYKKYTEKPLLKQDHISNF